MKIFAALVGFSVWSSVGSVAFAANTVKGKVVQCEFVKEVAYKSNQPNQPDKIDSIRLKALGGRKVCMGWAKCVVDGITRFSQVACSTGLGEDCKNATQCYLEEGAIEPQRFEGSKPKNTNPASGSTQDRPYSTGNAN